MFGVSWDNDIFFGTDGSYTNGIRVSWVGDTHQQCEEKTTFTCHTAEAFSWLPGVGEKNEKHALTVSLEQAMITPEDISVAEPNYNDLPYVGYSNVELGLFSWDDHRLVGYGVRLGVVGQDSGAEETQKAVHAITGSQAPQGWDNQLGPDVIGGAYVFVAERWRNGVRNNDWQYEWGYAAGVNANNFYGTARVGGFARLGKNLPGNFIPDYAGVGTAGSLVGLFDASGFGWEAFAGVYGEYIGYSYLVEKGDLYNVPGQDTAFSLVLGGGVRWNRFSSMLTMQGASTARRDDGDILGFGNLSLIWHY